MPCTKFDKLYFGNLECMTPIKMSQILSMLKHDFFKIVQVWDEKWAVT